MDRSIWSGSRNLRIGKNVSGLESTKLLPYLPLHWGVRSGSGFERVAPMRVQTSSYPNFMEKEGLGSNIPSFISSGYQSWRFLHFRPVTFVWREVTDKCGQLLQYRHLLGLW